MPYYAPGVAASAPDIGFDVVSVGQGMRARSTPDLVRRLFRIFNKCYRAGQYVVYHPRPKQDGLIRFVVVLLSPFIGMIGGILWALVRVLGTCRSAGSCVVAVTYARACLYACGMRSCTRHVCMRASLTH